MVSYLGPCGPAVACSLASPRGGEPATGLTSERSYTTNGDATHRGFLETVWAPDEQTRALRRLCARREALVRARTRAKNEAHAVVGRNLCGRPPVTDSFGKRGRAWLAGLQLPVDERLTLDGCLRQIDLLDHEVSVLKADLARHALGSPDVLRLMTVPGVSLHTATGFVAAVGDIQRFPSAKRLVGYLGLHPRVRQSGNGETRHGHISKAGSSLARGMNRDAVGVA